MPKSSLLSLLLITLVFAGCEGRQADKESTPPAAQAKTQDVSISFGSQPGSPTARKPARLHAEVRDSAGRAIPDAEVRVILVMPMGEMGDMREATDLQWDGERYRGEVTLPMAGEWNVAVEVSRDGKQIGRHETKITAGKSA